jgi:hypothetical protein
MLLKSANVLLAAALFGLLSMAAAALDAPYNGDLGSTKWFDLMRNASQNSAMLKALPGSNGQIRVPADCVEVSIVVTDGSGPYKGKVPTVRIVSTDDRVDNVPRYPFIFQGGNEPPNFYTVLKRDLDYDFYWVDAQGREDRFAIWKVPADAGKQVRLVFAVDGAARCKISVYAEQRRASK